jgi:hypothetical protein
VETKEARQEFLRLGKVYSCRVAKFLISTVFGSGFRNYGDFLWPKLVEMTLVLVGAEKNSKNVAWGKNSKANDNPKPIMIAA